MGSLNCFGCDNQTIELSVFHGARGIVQLLNVDGLARVGCQVKKMLQLQFSASVRLYEWFILLLHQQLLPSQADEKTVFGNQRCTVQQGIVPNMQMVKRAANSDIL